MDLAEIELWLDRVEEMQGEAECELVEVRDNISLPEAGRMLDDCEAELEGISDDIDTIKSKLQEGPGGVQFGDDITPSLLRLLRVGWKQEQLEDAFGALSRACR